MTDTALDASHLTFTYPNGEVALEDVSFKVRTPTFMAILGPNGSGKSTLIKLALGMLKPTSGSIRTLGLDPAVDGDKIRRAVRYVPQRDRIELSVPISVRDIVLMGRLLKRAPPRVVSRADIETAMSALARVEMDDLWNRSFNELSGGQRQRVLVARALATEGSLMVLDEPLSGTDARSQQLIVDALRDCYVKDHVSVIMVTHDLNPVHVLVKDVLVLKRTVVGIGRPCEVMDPKLLESVYGPSARIVEYAGHKYCVTHDSGVDRHD
ncbi:MAG: metal ABC transporter ATP-binding protein [Candidatus Thorarchaeota archaeon]